MSTTAYFTGQSNQGTQLGLNSGNIHIYNNGQPERSPTRLKPSSTVPFRRDPDFVDRDVLAAVGKKCSQPASRAALVGLGGVGKSQLAIEYSYRIREQFPQTWIFWVHASNAARFEEGYRLIADRIKLPRRDKPTADILQLVSSWLSDEANGRWIMILDNADDPMVFSEPRKGGNLDGGAVSLSTFIPQTPNGSILVTSRSEDAALALTGRRHDIIKVEPMDEDRALLLFEKKLQIQFNKGDGIELLRALDYMPLAISQAAAYISQRAPRITLARYLDDFSRSDKIRANLLNKHAPDLRRDSKASNSIITTWQMSFEYIRSKRPSAARLLSLMSFFDQRGIPGFLLHCHYEEEAGSNIDSKDDSELDLEDDGDMMFEDDLSILANYSLITTNVDDDQFEMHRLVQFSTRIWLERNRELERWKSKFIRIISDAFPIGVYENWTICQTLFPHAEAALAHRPAERSNLLYWSDVLNKAGCYAAMQGNYLMAEEMNRRALEERIKALGAEHPDTLKSVGDLAEVLLELGRYEEAEKMSRQALDGGKKVFGKEHSETLSSLSRLASVLAFQGKFKASEELNRQVLDGREKALGKEDPNTLTSVINLALVLRDQGEYKAAEKMVQRALDGRNKVLGKEHPDTLTSVSHLARVLYDQGNYEKAEAMERQALEGREKALGKDHRDTLVSVHNMAEALRYVGNFEAAEGMNRRVLAWCEKALGKEHPHTLTSVSNLALVLRSQGKCAAAEELHRRALDGREKALGKDHPDTLTGVSNLALVLRSQGKCAAAEELHRRALNGREKALGKDHPDTLTSVSNLAEVLHDQGNYAVAEELHRQALDGREKALGKDHPDTQTSASNLVLALKYREKLESSGGDAMTSA